MCPHKALLEQVTGNFSDRTVERGPRCAEASPSVAKVIVGNGTALWAFDHASLCGCRCSCDIHTTVVHYHLEGKHLGLLLGILFYLRAYSSAVYAPPSYCGNFEEDCYVIQMERTSKQKYNDFELVWSLAFQK